MKYRAFGIALLLGAILASSNADARGPYGSINIGNWKGGAFSNDQTGVFSHCVAGASYRSGIYFMVMVDDNFNWALGLTNRNWSITNGQTFQIALTFDGRPPFNVQGVAVNKSLVRVPMPDNSSLIAQFRKAQVMTAFTQGQLFQFKLDRTAQLLPTLANCAAKMKQFGVASAGDFSVPLPTNPVAKPVVATAPAQSSLPEIKSPKIFDQTGTGFVVSPNGHVVTMACTRFRRHQVKVFTGAGGVSWSDGSLRGSSSLRRYA